MNIVEWLKSLTLQPSSPSQPYYGRVSGKQFLELDVGHQTTFVTGLMDMLDFAVHEVSPQSAARYAAMTKYADQFKSGDLGQLFAQYLKADPVRDSYLISGNFVAFLLEGAKGAV